jgi:hypothetical protein
MRRDYCRKESQKPQKKVIVVSSLWLDSFRPQAERYIAK